MTDTNNTETLKKSVAPKYIPIENLIAASAEKNLSNSDVARLFDITPQTVSQRFKHAGYTPESLKNYQHNRAKIFDYFCSKIINSLTNRDIKKASFRDRIVAFGILYDKMRLESDQSTENVSVIQDIRTLDAEAKQEILNPKAKPEIKNKLKELTEGKK